jgi:hypothetical protein
MGLIVAGAASTGGLAALAVKLSRKKNGAGEINPNSNHLNSNHPNSNHPNSNQRRNQDVNQHD